MIVIYTSAVRRDVVCSTYRNLQQLSGRGGWRAHRVMQNDGHYDHRPPKPLNNGTQHTGCSLTKQLVVAPSAVRCLASRIKGELSCILRRIASNAGLAWSYSFVVWQNHWTKEPESRRAPKEASKPLATEGWTWK